MAFGKKKKTKDAAVIPDEAGVAESDIEEAIEAIRTYADQQGKQIDKMNEVLVQTNEKISKLEADIVSVEKAHTAMTQKVFENQEKLENFGIRFEGLAKAVSKMREPKQ